MPEFRIKKLADSLDWPSSNNTSNNDDTSSLSTVQVQCAGQGYYEYQRGLTIAAESYLLGDEDAEGEKTDEGENGANKSKKKDSSEINLFDLSERGLAQLNYYQVLQLPFKADLTSDDIKKAYRKASLKYHPDKSGRGEEDAVFLKVKTAFETLSTNKQAYDSTEMPFDERLPDADVPPEKFFAEFGMVFERNLHFDARLLDAKKNNGGAKNKKRRKSRNNKNDNGNDAQSSGPPSLGDDSTSIDEVHRFYDYWTHFSSWRDFSLQAAQELETQDHLDQAESRYEKRWYQKEIDKRAKKLKQQEQARITTLVERAMAVDPRLVKERQEQILEKERKQKQREEEALQKKKQEEQAKKEAEQKEMEEKKRRAEDKLQREKEKKMLRKAKQAFRKHVSEALDALGRPEHTMEDDVDQICGDLTRDLLLKLNARLEGKTPEQVIEIVCKRAQNLRDKTEEEEEEEEEAPAPAPAEEKESKSKADAKRPFTKEELSALVKGTKKFPPGGANRWDQICNYINNVCRPDIPRTREECIEAFNQAAKVTRNGNAATNGASAKDTPVSNGNASKENGDDEDEWTDEQDKQLQAGLAEFPASMDKNERWASIAKAVSGKSKKQCVQRFKTIREAIKNKK